MNCGRTDVRGSSSVVVVVVMVVVGCGATGRGCGGSLPKQQGSSRDQRGEKGQHAASGKQHM